MPQLYCDGLPVFTRGQTLGPRPAARDESDHEIPTGGVGTDPESESEPVVTVQL